MKNTAKASNTNPFRFPCSFCGRPITQPHIILTILTGARRAVRHFCTRACAGTWLVNAP